MSLAMIDRNTERFWNQLLEYIKEGRVIPIIGPETLILDIGGKTTHLYAYLAEQLANRLQIPFEPTDTLNTVACRFLYDGGQREDIYPELKRAMPKPSDVRLPEALVKLAEIRSFNLFVTTSFDPFLAHAINQVRYGGQEKTLVLEFSLGSSNDLPSTLERLERATVFHLFGKLTAVPEYAVTDEDILEFMHSLQSRSSQPGLLFDALIEQNLVAIGCPMSDWLGRFFVRLGKKDRLIISSGKTDFLAGDQLQSETKLADFLQHFSRRTLVFPMTSIEFINELYRRWVELQPMDLKATKSNDSKNKESERMQQGAVFLSYASEDRPTVYLIREALEQAGIDVWLDRNPDALRAGDDFEEMIKANIDRCSLFIPVISQHTLTPSPRFFRNEWNHAQDLALRYPDNRRFIIPVVIDDTPPDNLALPERFRRLQWEKLQDGQVHEAFVNEIKLLYRAYQLAIEQPA